MASGGKKKTTMAKLNRESRLRERRAEKKARKDARKLASAEAPDGLGATATDESAVSGVGEPSLGPVAQPLADV
jgi:hypothetical protein